MKNKLIENLLKENISQKKLSDSEKHTAQDLYKKLYNVAKDQIILNLKQPRTSERGYEKKIKEFKSKVSDLSNKYTELQSKLFSILKTHNYPDPFEMSSFKPLDLEGDIVKASDLSDKEISAILNKHF